MLSCVAPGCTYEATIVLMGMSLCGNHQEQWCQIQVSYYNTLPEKDLLSYQEFMVKAAEVYREAHPLPVVLPTTVI